jgi:hypothetical protein
MAKYNSNYLYSSENQTLLNTMINGVKNESLFIYLENKRIFIKISSVRCFSVSFRRLRNCLCVGDDYSVLHILVKNINNITVTKENENLFHLNIATYNVISKQQCASNVKIKIKEVVDFIEFNKNDDYKIIIDKQSEKITDLINKITEYEKKYKDPTTEDEMILMY